MSFQLTVITPEEKVLEREINLVNVPGIDGSFSILENHAPMIAGVGTGKLVITDKDNTVEKYQIENGFIEVKNNQVFLLVDSVVKN